MTEKGTVDLETKQTQDSVPDQEFEEASETAESKTSETETKETEETKETKPPAYTEEEVERRAQAKKDKELKTVYAEMDNLKKSHADLTRQLQLREDDKDLKALFEGDAETDGEETAKKRDVARRKFAARFAEYKEKAESVETKDKETTELAEKLGGIERRQNAREFYLELRDAGLVKTSDKDSIMKQLEDSETPREFELAKKGIKREYESKGTRHKPGAPDSGRQGGSGVDLDKMTPKEKIEYGLAHPKK